jgi:PPOX class probable FMN-dependent enzyme
VTAAAHGFTHVVADEGELDAILGAPPSATSAGKDIHALDGHCRRYIAQSPFCILATSGADGACRATPRGGPPGFVTVLDEHRLAIPDYTGNNRAEALRDLLANPHVQLLFLLPGMGEALRVGGTAVITCDPELLAALATGGTRPPKLALGVTVTQAFLQCAKALRRSQLWDPTVWLPGDELPRAREILRDHVADGRTAEEVQAGLDVSYAERAW